MDKVFHYISIIILDILCQTWLLTFVVNLTGFRITMDIHLWMCPEGVPSDIELWREHSWIFFPGWTKRRSWAEHQHLSLSVSWLWNQRDRQLYAVADMPFLQNVNTDKHILPSVSFFCHLLCHRSLKRNYYTGQFCKVLFSSSFS